MKKEEFKVYLFRHGQSEYNRDHRFTGWHDAKLTNEGKVHAKKIVEKLKNKRIDIAIHTSLSRSIDTLKPVLDTHPECKKVLCDDRMIERSYGVLQGQTHDEFIEYAGDLISEQSGMSYNKSEKKFLGEKEYDVIHRGYKSKALNGESFYDVEKRVKDFIKWLKSYVRKNKVNVAISAHGNSIRLFRMIMENASVEEMKKWFIPYDKVFEYKF